MQSVCPAGLKPAARAAEMISAGRTGQRPMLHNRAAASRSRAGRAGKAMITGHDGTIFERIGIDVPQEDGLPIIPLHPELLIKIAIVNFPAPADANRVAAHETFDSRRIERVDQKLHVLIELIDVAQVRGKSADGKIADCKESVKHDPEMLLQLALVIAFKLIL